MAKRVSTTRFGATSCRCGTAASLHRQPGLLAFVAEVTPPERKALLDDLFRSITLFDNRAVEAVSTRRPDGRYDVTVSAKARKLRADGKGVESQAPLDDWIDVGVFAAPTSGSSTPRALYLQKHHVTAVT